MVAILAVVAVGACGYLAFTLFGVGTSWVGQRTPEAKPSEKERGTLDQEYALIGDPFAPEFFLQKQAEAKEEAAKLAAANSAASDSSAIPAGLSTPPMPLPGNLNLQATAAALRPSEPAEIAGESRESKQESRIEVRLSAVVTAVKTVAFLSVSNQETRAYQVGDVIAAGWRVLHISDSAVEIGEGRRRKMLAVGQEVSL